MLQITNDRLTLLKLLAVVSMVIDHYNKFINPNYSQLMYSVGRLALPLFIFVMAFNLSRIEAAKMPSIAARLVLFGLLSIPAYNSMGGTILGGWWPLNILFLLAGLVGIVYLLELSVERPRLRRICRASALLIFLVVGALAEFFWVGLGLGLVAWKLFIVFSRGDIRHSKGRGDIAFLVLATTVLTALLCLINGNLWALVAAPLVLLVLWMPVGKLPRCKWFFYWFYPAHLCALWLVQAQ